MPRETDKGKSLGESERTRVRFWTRFVIVFLFALALCRVNAFFFFDNENPLLDPVEFTRNVDMRDNLDQALEILSNRGFPRDFFYHSPLYTYLIAAVYFFSPKGFMAVYWIQLVGGAILCGLVYAVGRTIRFHSMWYCDDIAGQAFWAQALKALDQGDLDEARAATERMQWVKRASSHFRAYALLSEIAAREGNEREPREFAGCTRRVLPGFRNL